jgi:adenine-specific DNA-methyltransferase
LDKNRGIPYHGLAVPDLPDYLKRQLIAYLGNKRALLPFLSQLFQRLLPRPGVVLDAFAGSGAVARLARSLGHEVHANDWEPYACVMNRAFLTLTPASAEAAFAERGGLGAALDRLNALKAPREEFIARWYAPKNTAEADWRTERLFYTRENALWLDAVREAVDGYAEPARTLLLALLVYEASTHANTNGVFKAYHKGFGGHGGDALKRILSPMELEYPALWDSPRPASASELDATGFLKGRTADLVYLDPPYNQHQYGSNYHLLNTVVRGDRFVPDRKAGIRRDWTETKSAFCARGRAPEAFAALLGAADARHLVVSYNTEGLVPFEQLYDLLDRRGRVELAVRDYVTYRGGRQSPERKTHNLEFVLVVETRERPGSGSRAAVDRFLAQKRLATLLKGAFVPSRLRAAFGGEGTGVAVDGRVWRTEDLHRFVAPDVDGLSDGTLRETAERLGRAACRSHQEEFDVLLGLLAAAPSRPRRVRRLVLVLRKFAFRQYRADYEAAYTRARAFAAASNDALLCRLLDELQVVAERRFSVVS